MIRLLTDEKDIDKNLLMKTLSGKKMLAYLRAY